MKPETTESSTRAGCSSLAANTICSGMLLLMLALCPPESEASDDSVAPLTPAEAESVGMDGSGLQGAVSAIENGDYGDIDALLVVRNNRLVLENYFSPQYYGQQYKHRIRSATKSITSAAIGIAIAQGEISGVDEKLLALVPQHLTIQNLDERKQAITLEHVLTMTLGLQWDEWGPGDNTAFKMDRTDDWVQYVLDQPMVEQPGERLNYNSGGTILLSAILQEATGRTVEDFSREFLFEPVGMSDWTWALVNEDISNTSAGIAMTRRDMARFGQLFLNRGQWLGKQVIPEQWVVTSTAEHIKGEGEYYSLYSYGYQWWRLQDHDPTVANLAVNDLYMAYGDGGQLILVIPHLDMVVVSTGSNFFDDSRLVLDMLRDHVFPAVLN